MSALLLWELLLGGAASAQSKPPKVIELKIPEPPPPPLPPPPQPGAEAEAGATADGAVASASAAGTRRGGRRAPREVLGESPAALWGRYQVVEITEGGETEDFGVKMERAGKAIDKDCIVVRMVFDFGPATDPGLPKVLLLSEQSECEKGGLGTYANELAVALPATWDTTPDGLTMTLPPVQGTASLVRLRRPSPDNLHSPPHWRGPEAKLERPETRFVVLAELPGKPTPGQPSTAIHLRSGNTVYHLEPEPADGTFGR